MPSRRLVAPLLAFFVAWATSGVAQARQISLQDGHITFDAPDDFTPLTPDEVARKFPMRNGPMEAMGNDIRAVTISYSLTVNAVKPEQLGELKNFLSSSFRRLIPDIEWIQNNFIDLNHTRWIILEMITPAAGGKVHNIEIATSYRDVMFVINFNSSQKEYDTYRDRLWTCLRSISVKTDPSLPSSRVSTEPPVSSDDEVARGQAALRNGNYSLAREAFNAALLLQPGKLNALAGLREVNAQRNSEKLPQTDPTEGPKIPEYAQGLEGWSDGKLALVGSSALVALIFILGGGLYFIMRKPPSTKPRQSPPVKRAPPRK